MSDIYAPTVEQFMGRPCIVRLGLPREFGVQMHDPIVTPRPTTHTRGWYRWTKRWKRWQAFESPVIERIVRKYANRRGFAVGRFVWRRAKMPVNILGHVALVECRALTFLTLDMRGEQREFLKGVIPYMNTVLDERGYTAGGFRFPMPTPLYAEAVPV